MPARSSKTCQKCGETKPLAAFVKNAQFGDGKWPFCKACFKQVRQRTARQYDSEYKIPIAKNEVATAVAQAILKYGSQWHWHIAYDDFMRVKMQLWAWINQLDSVHAGAFKEDADHNEAVLARLKNLRDKHWELATSNPEASFKAERFKHT